MDTKKMLGMLVVMVFLFVGLAGCVMSLPIMALNAGMTAVGIGGPMAIEKMANTHQLPWRQVRLKMELAGSPNDVRALREHATKVLKSRGVGVNPNAEYTMRVAEKGNLVGVEVLSPKKVAVADITVRYKANQTRAQALETAIRNLKLKDGVAKTGIRHSG